MKHIENGGSALLTPIFHTLRVPHWACFDKMDDGVRVPSAQRGTAYQSRVKRWEANPPRPCVLKERRRSRLLTTGSCRLAERVGSDQNGATLADEPPGQGAYRFAGVSEE